MSTWQNSLSVTGITNGMERGIREMFAQGQVYDFKGVIEGLESRGFRRFKPYNLRKFLDGVKWLQKETNHRGQVTYRGRK